MLLGELNKPEEYKNTIISFFMKANKIKIKRITYISDDGYGSGVNLYIARKDKNFTPLDAFLGLWLKNTIWEEELTNFKYTKEECSDIYNSLFLDAAEGYDLKKLSPKEASVSLAKSIKKELDSINKEDLSIEE